MAHICKHSGCSTAQARTRLNRGICPECGFALYPSDSTGYRVFTLICLFVILLVFWRSCIYEVIQSEQKAHPPELYFSQDNLPQKKVAQESTDVNPSRSSTKPNETGNNSQDLLLRAEQLADAIPYQVAQSATALARALARRGDPDEIRNPGLLARVVYRWVASNIPYDVESLEPTSRAPQDPDKVLRSRKAVCEGYACLCEFLLNQNQVETRIVHGLARTGAECIGRQLTSEQDGHAWLAVKWDDKWHLLEPTWGAGAIESRRFTARFSWEWFDCDPSIAIYSHIPEQIEMQLLQAPLPKVQIEQAAWLEPAFFRAVEMLPLPLVSGTIPQGSGVSVITWRIRPGFSIAAEAVLVGGSIKLTANVFTLPTGVTELRFPGLPSGTYNLSVFTAVSGQQALQQCGYFRIKQTGVSTSSRPPVLFQVYYDLGARLIVPLIADLTSGAWQRFALKAHSGLTFALQLEGETTMHFLSSNNDVYENSLYLSRGKLRLWQVENQKMHCLAEFDVK